MLCHYYSVGVSPCFLLENTSWKLLMAADGVYILFNRLYMQAMNSVLQSKTTSSEDAPAFGRKNIEMTLGLVARETVTAVQYLMPRRVAIERRGVKGLQLLLRNQASSWILPTSLYRTLRGVLVVQVVQGVCWRLVTWRPPTTCSLNSLVFRCESICKPDGQFGLRGWC